jgi:[histone H3]-lysine36 N-trimethyltransferase
MPKSEAPDESSRQASANDGATVEVKREMSADGELAQELSATRVATIKHENSRSPSLSPSLKPTRPEQSRSSSTSTVSSDRAAAADKDTLIAKKTEEPNGHAPTSASPIKSEPKETSRPAKSSRNASKLPARIAPLFDHLPDATADATSTFTVIDACTYQNKYLGYSEHALDCDCNEEWGMRVLKLIS